MPQSADISGTTHSGLGVVGVGPISKPDRNPALAALVGVMVDGIELAEVHPGDLLKNSAQPKARMSPMNECLPRSL